MKISKNALLLNRITIGLLAWISYFFQSSLAITIIFFLLLLSTILGFKKAPIIYFYQKIFDRFISSAREDVDVHAMKFVFAMGTVFSGICLFMVYFDAGTAWKIIFIFALLKTVNVFGYCPGEKIYAYFKKQ